VKTDEPRNHRRYLLLLGLLVLGTVPFPFIGGETRWLFGLPTWLWWSVVMTTALACTTAWGILRLWVDEDLE
jgi:hypothetical protein